MSRKVVNKVKKFMAMGSALMAAAVFFLIGSGLAAYGAESSVVEDITVTFKADYGEQGEIPDPEITVTGKGCSLGDVQYRTAYDRWKPGKKVRVEITLNADEGKVFPVSLTRSQCKVSGAEFVSAKALDDGTFQVKADYRPIVALADTERAGWSSKNAGRAVWKSVEYAPGYSLVLYGDDKVVKRMNVSTNSVDLSEFMADDDKTYYYEVKAVPTTSDEKKYLKEGNFVSSTSQELDWDEETDNGTGDGGSVKGNNYVLPDGTKETDTWKKIGGYWYYFDQRGSMAKGWQNIGGFWYYMDANGRMQTGWVNTEGDTWYYLYENGGMGVGWIQPQPGVWYYADGDGKMHRGWLSLNGKWYYLNPDGRMRTGWLQEGANAYYFFSDGSMAVNAMIEGRYIDVNGVAH